MQIDEAFFGGRAKYNRGRRLLGDREPFGEDAVRNELVQAETEPIQGWVKGPWIFGLYQDRQTITFIVFPDWKASTLIPLICKCVQEGSVAVLDEWTGYRQFSGYGYTHQTVCHKSNYVDPGTCLHTQAIERPWADAKVYIKRARGVGPLLQSHLDEQNVAESAQRYRKSRIAVRSILERCSQGIPGKNLDDGLARHSYTQRFGFTIYRAKACSKGHHVTLHRGVGVKK